MNELSNLPRPSKIDWAPGGTYGQANFSTDLVVLFYKKPVENKRKSLQAGRPIFEDRDFIKMHPPGERLNIIDRPARDDDKVRWPVQWAKFLQGQTQVPEGTPIELLFPNNPATAESLKAFGVFTVEQCSNLSAHAQDTIGIGAREYVNKAKKYLENAEKGAGFHKLQEELERKDSEISQLNHKLELAIAQIKALEQHIRNPVLASENPPFVPGYDVQAERINANHPTKEAATNKSKSTRKATKNAEKNSDDDEMEIDY